MRDILIPRAVYSFLATSFGLALVYYLLAVFPNPRLWWDNATTDHSMWVQAAVMLLLYGLPAWGVMHLALGVLGVADPDRRRRSRRASPGG